GAAIEFRRALLVNPYDPESVADAIAQALAMPIEERRARHQALLAVISAYDVDQWQREFLISLQGDDDSRNLNTKMGAQHQRSESTYPGSGAIVAGVNSAR
ncbi:MAG TPA: trehalose-6-phosphate synthase, partial [Xanthobacteraceae bacterium]|nr:trehalose-6-phosphate synthase [Xanthobacteraceae bacterium]